jgi:hypothetical protein
MHCASIRQLFPLMRYLADVPGSPPFSALKPVSLCDRISIGCTFRHEVMLHQQVIDEEGALIVFGFLVNPEFLLRYVRIPVVLAEIRELLIDVPADVCAIDYPNLKVASRFVFL